jgi:hypothetical protein
VSALDDVELRLASRVGNTEHEDLGVLTRRDFLRFATATNDQRYLEMVRAEPFDRAVPAPLLYLAGILHWASGPSGAELRADGLARRDAPGVTEPEDEHLNVMHGGQSIAFHARAYEGMEVRASRLLLSAQRKHGRDRNFLLVTTSTAFVASGTRLADVDDTILVLAR